LAIVRQIAAGKTNKEIAAALGCSDQTVKTHLSTAMDRVGVHTRAELTYRFGRWEREQGRAA
jgi:DNA-binding NarL/FixJ family response regulator